MDWDAITEADLIDLYHGKMMTLHQIADLYNTNNVRVLRKMSAFGIERRDYRIKLYPCTDSQINRRRADAAEKICAAFDKITPSRAYVLGLLATDGNIYADDEVTRISIASKDKEIVDIVLSVVGAGRINFREDRNLYEWRYCNRPLAARLSEFHIVPRKSHILRYPENLPAECHRHFIRGVFDGDGCVAAQTHSRKPVVRFVSASQEFLISLAEMMQSIAGTSARNIHTQTNHNTERSYFALAYATVNDCNHIYQFFYADGGERLTRKFDRFSTLLAPFQA